LAVGCTKKICHALNCLIQTQFHLTGSVTCSRKTGLLHTPGITPHGLSATKQLASNFNAPAWSCLYDLRPIENLYYPRLTGWMSDAGFTFKRQEIAARNATSYSLNSECVHVLFANFLDSL